VKTVLEERLFQESEDIKESVAAEITAVSLEAIDDYLC